MSLINDALKRAKAAQAQAPQGPLNLPLRPVEPGQKHARQNLGLFMPVALALVALLALFLVWRWAQARQPGTPAEVAVRAVAPAAPVAPELPAQPAPAPEPVATPVVAPVEAPVIAPEAAPATEPPAPPLAEVQETETATEAPAPAPAPPKPAALRLQGILYNPHHPSAMVNGKTLFVGDRLGDLRVVAIARNGVTLANSARTNVLFLSD